MDAIYQAIHDFDAHLSTKEFSCLCSAIYFTRAALPNPPPMKSLCADIRQQTGCRTAAAALRCVERAVARIFERETKRGWQHIRRAGYTKPRHRMSSFVSWRVVCVRIRRNLSALLLVLFVINATRHRRNKRIVALQVFSCRATGYDYYELFIRSIIKNAFSNCFIC